MKMLPSSVRTITRCGMTELGFASNCSITSENYSLSLSPPGDPPDFGLGSFELVRAEGCSGIERSITRAGEKVEKVTRYRRLG